MDFKSMLPGQAADLGHLAQDKVLQWLDDYKRAAAWLETFGFKTTRFSVSMALIPEVHTTFVGSIDAIQVDKLEALAAAKPDDALLGHLVKALVMLRKFHAHVELKLQEVRLHVTLGLPPKIDVETV